MKVMRIVLFPAPPYQEIGGVATHVHMLANGLEAVGNQVVVINENPPDWVRIPFIRIPEILLSKLNLYYSRRFRRYAEDLYYALSVMWQTKGKLDVINVQNVQHADIAKKIKQWTGCGFILTVHGYLTYEAEARRWCQVGDCTHRWLWSLETSGYTKPDSIVCVASKTRTYVEKFSTKNIHLIYNGIDTSVFFPDPERAGRRRGQATVLFAGILQEAKGIMEALEIIRRLTANTNLPVLFRVAGNGPQANEARQFVQKHGLGKYVEFLGAVSREHMPDYFQSGDILLFTSKQAGLSGCAEESLPYSVLEAMSCGVPAVAFNTGGLGELIVHGETGFLCEPGDTQLGAEYLLKLIENVDLMNKMRDKCRQLCVDRFSHYFMAQQYMNVYNEPHK
jgi:glycosyltransferase involved in cell wall biosynthesis